eukprot:g2207.t1
MVIRFDYEFGAESADDVNTGWNTSTTTTTNWKPTSKPRSRGQKRRRRLQELRMRRKNEKGNTSSSSSLGRQLYTKSSRSLTMADDYDTMGRIHRTESRAKAVALGILSWPATDGDGGVLSPQRYNFQDQLVNVTENVKLLNANRTRLRNRRSRAIQEEKRQEEKIAKECPGPVWGSDAGRPMGHVIDNLREGNNTLLVNSNALDFGLSIRSHPMQRGGSISQQGRGEGTLRNINNHLTMVLDKNSKLGHQTLRAFKMQKAAVHKKRERNKSDKSNEKDLFNMHQPSYDHVVFFDKLKDARKQCKRLRNIQKQARTEYQLARDSIIFGRSSVLENETKSVDGEESMVYTLPDKIEDAKPATDNADNGEGTEAVGGKEDATSDTDAEKSHEKKDDSTIVLPLMPSVSPIKKMAVAEETNDDEGSPSAKWFTWPKQP